MQVPFSFFPTQMVACYTQLYSLFLLFFHSMYLGDLSKSVPKKLLYSFLWPQSTLLSGCVIFYLTSSPGNGFQSFAIANTAAMPSVYHFAPTGVCRIPQCLIVPRCYSLLYFHVLCISSDPHHCRQKPPS